MAKYSLLRERVVNEIAGVKLHQAPAATDGELALAHAPSYIRAVADGLLPAAAQREIGFPWSLAMVERSRRSAGATIAAVRAAVGAIGKGRGEGIAANLAGGTHHAAADKGGGFCVFNDSAVAARLMQAEQARRARGSTPLQVAIVDLDVHQGNGTASIFAGDPSVFTLSLHGAKNFPFRKETSDLDVELADGCTDAPYLQALQHALAELDRRFQPGLVIYIAGADPFVGDRLGRLALSFEGLQARDRQVFEWAWERRVPLAFSMAGGYGVNIHDTVQVQINTWRIAMEYWHRWNP